MQNAEPVLGEASRPNRAACALDLEGIVAKRFDDVYEPLIDGHNPGMRPCEIADVEPRDVAGFRRVKGKVERPYRYIREDFFLARSFRNLDDLLGRCLPPDSCCRSGTRFLNYSPLRILP